MKIIAIKIQWRVLTIKFLEKDMVQAEMVVNQKIIPKINRLRKD